MDNTLKKGLGKKIRYFRKLEGLTQETLGEKAGISYKFIGEIERGEVNPSVDSLISIANALSVKVKNLFPSETDVTTQLSPEDIEIIKKALKLLNKLFSKV